MDSKLSAMQMSSRYVRCTPNAVDERSRDHHAERSSVLGTFAQYLRKQAKRRNKNERFPCLQSFFGPEANKGFASAAGHNQLPATFRLKARDDSFNRFDLMG